MAEYEPANKWPKVAAIGWEQGESRQPRKSRSKKIELQSTTIENHDHITTNSLTLNIRVDDQRDKKNRLHQRKYHYSPSSLQQWSSVLGVHRFQSANHNQSTQHRETNLGWKQGRKKKKTCHKTAFPGLSCKYHSQTNPCRDQEENRPLIRVSLLDWKVYCDGEFDYCNTPEQTVRDYSPSDLPLHLTPRSRRCTKKQSNSNK